MIKVICSACSKPLSIDETRLPMREVAFPCPVCKTKLTIDRRQVTPGSTVTAPLAGAPSAGSPPGSPASTSPSSGSDAEDSEFTNVALLVGEESDALRQAIRSIGFRPVHFKEAAVARDHFLREFPPVVFMAPAPITQPPMEALAPLTSIGPSDRRKAFFILVAENLKSMDGNAAFLYQVNLVVATKDLAALPRIFHEAERAHERLYNQMTSLLVTR